MTYLSLRRKARQARALAGLAAALCFALAWSFLPRSFSPRRAVEKMVWRSLLGGFGIELRATGAPRPGSILGANHISWADIAVLAALCPATFVAKKDMAGWPVLGALAARHGCVFTDRGSRSSARADVLQLQDLSASGRGAVVFAEGTTGDGFSVRTFKSTLFEAACQCGADITPVAITYRNRDGSAQSPIQRRLVAWLGDDSLLPHALALAASGGAIAEVHFGEPFIALDRKDAAFRCREAIMRQLGFADQAAMRNLLA